MGKCGSEILEILGNPILSHPLGNQAAAPGLGGCSHLGLTFEGCPGGSGGAGKGRGQADGTAQKPQRATGQPGLVWAEKILKGGIKFGLERNPHCGQPVSWQQGREGVG